MITNLQIVHYVPEAIFYMAEFTFVGFCSGNRYLALPSDKEGCTLDASVNAQINTEMAAFYEYLNMVCKTF